MARELWITTDNLKSSYRKQDFQINLSSKMVNLKFKYWIDSSTCYQRSRPQLSSLDSLLDDSTEATQSNSGKFGYFCCHDHDLDLL